MSLMHIVKKIWGIAGSLQMVIILLILITIASIAGVAVPQDLPADSYWQTMAGIRAELVLAAGLDHVFSSWWFYALLCLLAVNIIACLTTRQLKNLRNSFRAVFLPGTDHAAKLACFQSFEMRGEVQRISGLTVACFRRRFFRCATQKADPVFQVAARTPGLRAAGSVIFHLSILLLFIGGVLGQKGGASYVCELCRGEAVEIRGTPYLVKCDWFRVERNGEGVISGYTSGLTILDRDLTVHAAENISVNHPMSFKGFRLYQNSYGEQPGGIEEAQLRIRGPGIDSAGYVGTFPFDSGVAIPGDLAVRVRRYVCDFNYDMDRNAVSTRSESPNNPAVEVEIVKGQEVLYKGWAFALYPDVQQDRSHGYTVEFERYRPLYCTGIKISKNPGAPFIWSAFIFMTIGIFLVFYFPQKSFWVFIEPAGTQELKISIGGASDRPHSSFQAEFDKTSSDLKRRLCQGEQP